MATMGETVSGSAPGLRRDAIGLREVLFQSITDMAPGAAIAASIPAGAAFLVHIDDFRRRGTRPGHLRQVSRLAI